MLSGRSGLLVACNTYFDSGFAALFAEKFTFPSGSLDSTAALPPDSTKRLPRRRSRKGERYGPVKQSFTANRWAKPTGEVSVGN